MREFNCEDNATYVPGQKKIIPTGTIEITENGTFDVAQYANADVNVSGGGGGNVVVGDFIVDSETGKTQTINLDYTGNGFPVALFVYPFGGALDPTTNGVVEVPLRFGLYSFIFLKGNLVAPSYDGVNGQNTNGQKIEVYKSSTSNPASLATRFTANRSIYRPEATSAFPNVFTSNKTLQMYIPENPDYTFIPGGHYSYIVYYSE